MNKIIKVFGFLTFISIPLLLIGCGNSEKKHTDEQPKVSKNEILQIVKDFANEYGLDESTIDKKTTEWSNPADDNYDHEYNWYSKGYGLIKTGVKTESFNFVKFFDGWNLVDYEHGVNGIKEIYEYTNNSIICLYSRKIEQTPPLELMTIHYDMDEVTIKQFKEKWKRFLEKATYSIEFSCGLLDGNEPLFSKNYFDAQGGNSSWKAWIRGDYVSFSTGDKIITDYIDGMRWEPDEGYYFYGDDIKGSYEKTPCKDSTTGEKFDYKISITTDFLEDEEEYHYEGCANRHYDDFLQGEIGMLDGFIKKTGYEYTGEYNHDNVTYYIDSIITDYIKVILIEGTGLDEKSHDILLDKTDNGWKVVYEGDMAEKRSMIIDQIRKHKCDLIVEEKNVDEQIEYCEGADELEDKYDEVIEFCNKYREYDKNLMEIFFFKECPNEDEEEDE